MWALAMLVIDFFITPQPREDGSNLTCAFQHAVGPSTAFLPATVGVATVQVQGWAAQPPDVKATLARCEAHQKLMCHGSSTLLDLLRASEHEVLERAHGPAETPSIVLLLACRAVSSPQVPSLVVQAAAVNSALACYRVFVGRPYRLSPGQSSSWSLNGL
jgi:hypothetical protein